MQIPDLFLGALFPVVEQLVEWLKTTPAFNRTNALTLSVSLSVVLVTVYALLPEGVKQYVLTVAIPVGAAAVFHEGKTVVKTYNPSLNYDPAENLDHTP